MYYPIEEKGTRPVDPSARLARFAAGLRFDQVNAAAVHAAKRAVLDLVGAALAGYHRSDIGRHLLRYLRSFGGEPQATLWGTGRQLPASLAAQYNAAIGHALELDDGHREGAAHIGTVVVPAALAVAEWQRKSGRDLLTAVVAGYEVMGRLAAAINPRHFLRGFHTTGCTGSFGSAAAAVNLMGLGPDAALGAFGTAGVQFAGLLEVVHTGQEVKGIHAGRAAEAGVMAAVLATLGVHGPQAILEGPKAFVHAMTDRVDWDRLVNGLGSGTGWEVCKAYTKPYPTCRHCHAGIDMALAIRQAHAPDPARIGEIVIHTYSVALHEVGVIHRPQSSLDAKFSLPWSVAAALALGRVTMAEQEPPWLDDPRLQELAARVRVDLDPAWDQVYPQIRGARMTIRMSDGTVYEWQVDLPKGEPETALTDQEMLVKFHQLADAAIGPERAAAAAGLILRLDQLTDLSELMAQLSDSLQ